MTEPPGIQSEKLTIPLGLGGALLEACLACMPMVLGHFDPKEILLSLGLKLWCTPRPQTLKKSIRIQSNPDRYVLLVMVGSLSPLPSPPLPPPVSLSLRSEKLQFD